MDSLASSKPQPQLLDQVLVEDNSFSKTLILNRPKQLNALSYQMVSRLLELFLAYEGDPNVKFLILKGSGRAFCAGGDVAAVVRDISKDHWKSGAEYFCKEFTLNYILATYTKPQVSILNGIVMGGGAGASIHGRFRVATENSVFAMPETALGLFPDVGASYFLSRLPGFFGEYVGLTGARLDGAEMLACGLATHFVPSAKLPLLEEGLIKLDSSDPAAISAIIDGCSERPYLKEKSAYHREGRLQGVGQCLVREYRMVCHVMRGKLSKDFFEGCRAILLEKDKNPKWEPSQWDLVSDAMVEEYFSKVDDQEWEDLKLPARFNLPGHAIAKL
ncbi:unnamed protein product [Dovyalis caffra]|uniref:3-hydroxyisobutyryl-CoA hydrolase n=1 Tax=Dovyalis caffra TaxID=77055 RepID=A0AAV1SG68_9ROSI|nr:unnamed protein product [Dovyalis caffra]